MNSELIQKCSGKRRGARFGLSDYPITVGGIKWYELHTVVPGTAGQATDISPDVEM
ncbi:MAG: hypothetical protein ACI8P9_003403 [Parasphingorhabdus sp.]|jgi:hypothetical protein